MTPASPPTPWDKTVDFLVVGSGGGAFVGALAAAQRGAEVLMLEKTERFGGSTALSGGAIWVPANSLMREAGVADSLEDALRYLQATVGERTPRQMQERYLQTAPRMLDFLRGLGLQFRRTPNLPDYWVERPGGHLLGRSVESVPFAGRRLGAMYPQLRQREGIAKLPVTTAEYRALMLMTRSLGRLFATLRGFARIALATLFGRRPLAMGAALIAQLYLAARALGVELWLESPLLGLVTDGERVVAARVRHQGRELTIGARKGVLLAAGGFAHNLQMRQAHHPPPIGTGWTSAAPGDTGDAIVAGVELGARTDLMNDAWWGPSSLPHGVPLFHVLERALPGAVMVDARGERFMNEAQSYTDAVHHIYAHHPKVACIPAWLVMGARYRRRYPLGQLPPGLSPGWALRSGYLKQAPTLEALAQECGIDATGLKATVERFNQFAREGVDRDFRRGESAFDRSNSDPTVGPNPSLAELEPPFSAVALWPGDLGTKGGLVIDSNARVTRPDGQVIEGLYAAGNTTASVMGTSYPGPGATIGPAMTFGFLAAEHALS